MNYGGVRLSEDFLDDAYGQCLERDVPVLADEIQTCAWSPEIFLFREYGLRPDFIAVGKGLPGGQYAGSRIITTPGMDNLNQFGALVTNGQEELGSLAYLITMAFIRANRAYLLAVGEYYENRLRDLAKTHEQKVHKVEGLRHMTSLHFRSREQAADFAGFLSDNCIDISVQTYKRDCPPAALTKLPITTTPKAVDFLIGKMHDALNRM